MIGKQPDRLKGRVRAPKEGIANPIMTKLYQAGAAGGAGGMPGGFPGAGAQQPSGVGDTSGLTID